MRILTGFRRDSHGSLSMCVHRAKFRSEYTGLSNRFSTAAAVCRLVRKRGPGVPRARPEIRDEKNARKIGTKERREGKAREREREMRQVLPLQPRALCHLLKLAGRARGAAERETNHWPHTSRRELLYRSEPYSTRVQGGWDGDQDFMSASFGCR